MAELADALDSGSNEGSFMQVQVLLSAPESSFYHPMEAAFFYSFRFFMEVL